MQWQIAENVGLFGTPSLSKCEKEEFVKWIFLKRLLKTPNLWPLQLGFEGYIITEPVWTNLNQFEPIWTNLNQFECYKVQNALHLAKTGI